MSADARETTFVFEELSNLGLVVSPLERCVIRLEVHRRRKIERMTGIQQ